MQGVGAQHRLLPFPHCQYFNLYFDAGAVGLIVICAPPILQQGWEKDCNFKKKRRMMMDWDELGQRKKAFATTKKLECFGFVGFFFNKGLQRVRGDIITIVNIRGVIKWRRVTSCSPSPRRTSEGRMHLSCGKQPVA